MHPPVNPHASSGALVRVSIVQAKPQKGRYRENLDAVQHAFEQLAALEAPPDLIVLPEGALTGYFLEGAVYELAVDRNHIAADLEQAWRACSKRPVDIACGFFENSGGTYYNSAIYVEIGEREQIVRHVHRKLFLPTYGVFDEERFLSRGRTISAFDTRFGRMAMLICEDVWHAIVPTIAAIKGARVLIVPSAAPGRGVEERGEELQSVLRWRDILHATAAEHGVYVVYAGLAGFEGGKGMTGSSCIVDPRGRTTIEAPALGAHIVNGTIDAREIEIARASLPLLGDLSAVLPDLLLDEELPVHRCQPCHAEPTACHAEVSKHEPVEGP